VRLLIEVREIFYSVLVSVVFKRNGQIFYESLHYGGTLILE